MATQRTAFITGATSGFGAAATEPVGHRVGTLGLEQATGLAHAVRQGDTVAHGTVLSTRFMRTTPVRGWRAAGAG